MSNAAARSRSRYDLQCADTSGLSRSQNDQRVCPACDTLLQNPDDVVVAGLNPSEDYKTSVLSGLSPTIIMECASRGLAFHSYQTSQEIIYQEHLAKGLTEKYNILSQQMDQLIHEANLQIKGLQEKVQAQHADQVDLEDKNNALRDEYQKKCKEYARLDKMYRNLKSVVMVPQVAAAAGNEVEQTLDTAQRNRFIDRVPGARSGAGAYSHVGIGQQTGGGRIHNKAGSGSSSSKRRLANLHRMEHLAKAKYQYLVEHVKVLYPVRILGTCTKPHL
ncbi:hypothetical protein N0V94_008278 [Neodidymelliopsis sp. IMI 364377]|nr:hypothetical protein N0V94_008278 [Neodidymelliopsis sp. IMI 364377]